MMAVMALAFMVVGCTAVFAADSDATDSTSPVTIVEVEDGINVIFHSDVGAGTQATAEGRITGIGATITGYYGAFEIKNMANVPSITDDVKTYLINEQTSSVSGAVVKTMNVAISSASPAELAAAVIAVENYASVVNAATVADNAKFTLNYVEGTLFIEGVVDADGETVKAMIDAAVADASEDLFTQEDVDAAVADAKASVDNSVIWCLVAIFGIAAGVLGLVVVRAFMKSKKEGRAFL